MHNRFLAVSLIISVVLISGCVSTKDKAPTFETGPCYLQCSGIVYDSNSNIETKDDAQSVFNQYLTESYPNLQLTFEINDKKAWEIAQDPRLNVSDEYYYILPNCDELLNRMPELKSNIPGVCTHFAVTSNGKVCSTSRGPC